METAKEILAYLATHGPAIAGIILMIIGVAEGVVRLTPTKKDDGAVERIGKRVRQVFDFVGPLIPNRKAEGGAHPPVEIK